MSNIRQSVTLYCRGWNNSNQVRPFRRVLQNAVFMEQENTIASKTGIVLNQSIFFMIFSDPEYEYIPFAEWDKLTESQYAGKWTVELGQTASFIVPFVSTHEFNWGTQSNISSLENAFINANGARRVAGLEDNRRGSKKVQHLSLRC